MTYNVGFFEADGTVRDEKSYKDYDVAFDDMMNRYKSYYHSNGRVPLNLAIGYYENGKLIGTDRLIIKQEN